MIGFQYNFARLRKIDMKRDSFFTTNLMLKLVIYTSLAMDSNLKLQSLVETTVIVGQFFCLVRDVDNIFIFTASYLKKKFSV